MTPELARQLSYIAASVLFVFGLKMLSSAATARKGNLLSAVGMLIAIVATCTKLVDFKWVIVGAVAGSVIGFAAAKMVKMTSMPEMVGLFNGFGGLASLLVGLSEFHGPWSRAWAAVNAGGGELGGKIVQAVANATGAGGGISTFTIVAIFLTILIGGVTFSGSVVAYAKLAGKITGKPILFKGQNIVNGAIVLGIVGLGITFGTRKLHLLNAAGLQATYYMLIGAVVLALILGIMSTIPIGGADMPVVVCLLNSYSGLAACAAGFVINNNVLIVSGSLVGASGLILTNIMCKAMNRSLANVLFSGFGTVTDSAATGGGYQGEAKPVSPEDTYLMLEAASSVVIVPGYGMAAAQAQHVVRELGELLEENGADVKYCIHPVAGRMPGHMNVLLAEANVPYEQLVEPPDFNPTMDMVDIAIVIGANDVVNPAARDDENSPLAGMPIIEVDRARTTIVLKRSLNVGFAGVDNPLFFKQNTRMLFGDAKASIASVVSQFKD